MAEAHQLHWVARVFLLDLGDEVVGLGPLRDWYARAAHYWLRKRDRLPYLDRGGALRLRGDDLRRARAHRGRRGCLELVQLGLEGEELVIRHFFRPVRALRRHRKVKGCGTGYLRCLTLTLRNLRKRSTLLLS